MIMKYTHYLFPTFVLAITLGFSGCYDMDTLPLNQYLTEEQKEQAKLDNPEVAQAGITGITAIFSTFGQVTGTHDDFGFPAVMLYSDSRGIDLIGNDTGYNWFSPAAAMNNTSPTADQTALCWNNCYKQIFACNVAIKSISYDTEDPLLQFYLAQAKAVRAYDYLILAQTYQFTYVGNEDKPCVMLVTEKNADDYAINGAGRASVKDVYGQIISDLDSAVTLLKSSKLTPDDVLSSKPKRFISLATAYGLRARVKLIMNLWEEAAADANAAIEHFNGAPMSMAGAGKPCLNSMDEANWMWGIAIAPTDRVVTSGIVNWPSHMGSFCYGYASVGAWRTVNKLLYEYIPDTDVRKGWVLDGNSKSKNLTEAQQAFVDVYEMPPYTQVKFAPYGNMLGTSENANDIPLMRIEEMYYIAAEATAMAGGDGATILNSFVQSYRNPAYAFSGVGQAVQEECWMQRRIEFLGEGLTTFDLMRLKKDFDRTGGGWLSVFNYNVKADDPVLLLCIPETEENGNKAFSSADNNLSVGRPVAVI